MFELMRMMLSHMDKKDIKENSNFQILKGIYKIPDSLGEAMKQYKLS